MDNRNGAAPTLLEIAGITGGRLHVPVPALRDSRITGVCSDTRRIREGNLFVAIAGERYDGHDFVPEAMRSGACASLVAADWHEGRPDRESPDGARIVVPEVLPALQAFAGWHRSRFELPVIAVTGSNGKTTTKNMIAAVLSERYRVFKTPGNLNSQLGVSEALFTLEEGHGAAVLELGMNRAGELDRLARMTRPSVGVITNVGPAHIEFFESIEGIARAKGEILDHLPADGRAILNADDLLVMKQSGRSPAQVTTFGRGAGADVRLVRSGTELSGSIFTLSNGAVFRTNLMGDHQVMNSVAAVAVGRLFGIDDKCIARALQRVGPTPMRMEYRQLGAVHLIDDTYNANPSSMKAALDALAATDGRKLAVLGDMLELGGTGKAAHREIGKHAAGVAERIITVGDLARDIAEAAVDEGMRASRVVACSSNDEAAAVALAEIRDGDVVLVKGSRGMRMETVVESMTTALCKPVEG
ncbi:MAG: UDP-N-acetylmuramoyl-tripeptide--D-alanyl-D-alanine ligase [Gemmatimonadetes bacterium]|nr:UDP-N-acetylmuramoyl-tripeptide--D-alanyl-D-alanine ligase [Gemmatimonadota bacterium]